MAIFGQNVISTKIVIAKPLITFDLLKIFRENKI